MDREQQRRARHQSPDVEVASGLARRDRAQPGGRERRERGLGHRVGHRAARGADALLAGALELHQLRRGGHAHHAGVNARRDGHAWKLVRASGGAVELPPHEERLGEEVVEEAEAGDDAVDAEARRLVAEDLDRKHVTRLGTVDEDGAGERVAEPEVEGAAVRMTAVAGELAVEPVPRLEDDLVARLDPGDGIEPRVPPVVSRRRRDPQRSSPIRIAATAAASISSSVQLRGEPSWCTETIATSVSPERTGVTICAARPP